MRLIHSTLRMPPLFPGLWSVIASAASRSPSPSPAWWVTGASGGLGQPAYRLATRRAREVAMCGCRPPLTRTTPPFTREYRHDAPLRASSRCDRRRSRPVQAIWATAGVVAPVAADSACDSGEDQRLCRSSTCSKLPSRRATTSSGRPVRQAIDAVRDGSRAQQDLRTAPTDGQCLSVGTQEPRRPQRPPVAGKPTRPTVSPRRSTGTSGIAARD